MIRLVLAFSSFFRLLFGANLHPRCAQYLPEDALRKALPEPKEKKAESSPKKETKEPDAKAEKAKEKEVAKKKAQSTAEQQRDGALALLGLLQREGRLVDFLGESLDDYEDSDIGAAVRDIHRGCAKVMKEHVDLEPVMPGDEDDEVTVPKGFDPGETRLIGDVKGEPPFKGVLRHHGWRATSLKLPTLAEGIDRHVIAPAEVELGS
jgi:hypothetical protein